MRTHAFFTNTFVIHTNARRYCHGEFIPLWETTSTWQCCYLHVLSMSVTNLTNHEIVTRENDDVFVRAVSNRYCRYEYKERITNGKKINESNHVVSYHNIIIIGKQQLESSKQTEFLIKSSFNK